VCACSLRYPACNAHAPYCHLWPIRLYDIFPHYLINGSIFGGVGGKILNSKCVFRFSLHLLPETFLILRRIQRDIGINVCAPVFMQSAGYYWQILWNLKFLDILKYQISWKFIQWEPSCSMRTGRRTGMRKLIVAFRHFAKVAKNNQLLLYREIIAVCSQIHTKHITWIIYKVPVRTAQ